MKYYFDSEDEGPARETSHPAFVQAMTADFYYDCTDDFSPFGNDEGADLLYQLEDWYRSKKLSRNIEKWMYQHIDDMGFTYQSKGCAPILDLDTLKTIQEEDDYMLLSMDQCIIATGFGQLKITGILEPRLKELSLTALKRQMLLDADDGEDTEYQERLQTMINDLEKLD